MKVVVLRIYVPLIIFQSYRDSEAGDTQSLKLKWRDWESNPRPLALQARSLTTALPIMKEHLRTLKLLQNMYLSVHAFNKSLNPTFGSEYIVVLYKYNKYKNSEFAKF